MQIRERMLRVSLVVENVAAARTHSIFGIRGEGGGEGGGGSRRLAFLWRLLCPWKREKRMGRHGWRDTA